jgi:hypothetical protein
VGAVAPVVDLQAILAPIDIGERLRLLVEAVYARHQFFHPWYRWARADAVALPEIGEYIAAGQAQLESLVQAFLSASFGKKISPRHLALVTVMLDYPAWQRLVAMPPGAEQASDVAVHALRLLLSPLKESE